MLPLLIGMGAAASTIYNLYQSDKITEQAKTKSLKAVNRALEENIRAQQQIERAKTSMLRLANRKKAILMTAIPKFLELYEKLIKINFTEGDGIKELSYFPAVTVEEMQIQTKAVGQIMTDSEATAYLVAIGASGFAMIAVNAGIAVSTATTTITAGTISGAAIAAVPAAIGVTAVALPFVAGLSIKKDAEGKLKEAGQIAKQSKLQQTHYENVALSYAAIEIRCNKMTDILTKLNIIFKKSLDYSFKLIEKNGIDKNNYSSNDRKSLAGCINLAKAVKGILDVPLLDENNEISKSSLEAIELGTTYISKMANI